jgi:hypothetical protein
MVKGERESLVSLVDKLEINLARVTPCKGGKV